MFYVVLHFVSTSIPWQGWKCVSPALCVNQYSVTRLKTVVLHCVIQHSMTRLKTVCVVLHCVIQYSVTRLEWYIVLETQCVIQSFFLSALVSAVLWCNSFLACAAQVATLFRATTLATTLMDQYMKMTSTDFVRQAVQQGVQKVMELKHSCEVSELWCCWAAGDKTLEWLIHWAITSELYIELWLLLYSAVPHYWADSCFCHIVTVYELPLLFYSAFWIYTKVVSLQRFWVVTWPGAWWNCCHLGAFCVHPPHNNAPCHSSSCRATYVAYGACMFSCNLHFWQNGQDLLLASVVTQGGMDTETRVSTESWP